MTAAFPKAFDAANYEVSGHEHLVRFVTADNPSQLERVSALFHEASEKQETLYVSLPVVLELLWVLTSTYEVSRDAFVAALDQLISLPFLRFEQKHLIRDFLKESPKSRLDLADLLVAISGRHAGCTTTLTFDRTAARSPLFTALQGTVSSDAYFLERVLRGLRHPPSRRCQLLRTGPQDPINLSAASISSQSTRSSPPR